MPTTRERARSSSCGRGCNEDVVGPLGDRRRSRRRGSRSASRSRSPAGRLSRTRVLGWSCASVLLLAFAVWAVSGALHGHSWSSDAPFRLGSAASLHPLVDRAPAPPSPPHINRSKWSARRPWHAALSSFCSDPVSFIGCALGRLWDTFDTSLETYPLLTNALAMCIITVTGDLLAQCAEVGRRKGGMRIGVQGGLDLRRVLAVALDCMLFSGPVTWAAYEVMESVIPSSASPLMAVLQVIVDETILDSMCILGFFVITGLLEGWEMSKISHQLQTGYKPAFIGAKMSSLLCVPATIYRYSSVAVKYRILMVCASDLMWTASVSFFSHRPDDDDDDDQSDGCIQAEGKCAAVVQGGWERSGGRLVRN